MFAERVFYLKEATMSKDPAVLFYTSDFLAGTLTMSNEHIGMYIKLLCLQHQKGKLTKRDMLYICSTYVVDVFEKFKEDGDFFYNERMFNESERRQKYSKSRRENIAKRYEKKSKEDSTYVVHMETETETETITKKDICVDEIKDFETLFKYWEVNKKGGAYKKDSRKRMLDKLKKLTGNDFEYAKEAILHCVDSKYQGFCDGSELYFKKNKGKGGCPDCHGSGQKQVYGTGGSRIVPCYHDKLK